MTIFNMYYSPTGNSKKIITKISEQMMEECIDWDITVPSKRQSTPTFTKEDILFIAIPVYAGRVPKLLFEYFSQLNGSQARVVLVVTYGNRAYEDALLELKDLFVLRGFQPVAAAAFVAEHSATNLLGTARPDVHDLEIAVEFGKKVKENSSVKSLQIPGNSPYVVKQIPVISAIPETNQSCIECGLCAKHCPTSAIDVNDYKNITVEQCIKCRSCVKRCPVNAKEIMHPAYVKMQNMLVENFAEQRKEAEYFI